MDLCTNAGIVSDALKFVTQSQQKIDTLQKLDERIEAIEEEEAETTTNGVLDSMVQDDSYYINLGYEYARRRKELDLLNKKSRIYLLKLSK
jgi:hypothetical protein